MAKALTGVALDDEDFERLDRLAASPWFRRQVVGCDELTRSDVIRIVLRSGLELYEEREALQATDAHGGSDE